MIAIILISIAGLVSVISLSLACPAVLMMIWFHENSRFNGGENDRQDRDGENINV